MVDIIYYTGAQISKAIIENLNGANEIATPRLVGARNDKKWRPDKSGNYKKSGCVRR